MGLLAHPVAALDALATFSPLDFHEGRRMKTLGLEASEEQQRQFKARRCGACGHRADEHRHLFGSENYICQTVATFIEEGPDESGECPDCVPEFVVWVVRRGSRFPMVVDSIFVNEKPAHDRAKLMGLGDGWKAERYSHLKPPDEPPSSDAVDPHASSTGTPTPREKEGSE